MGASPSATALAGSAFCADSAGSSPQYLIASADGADDAHEHAAQRFFDALSMAVAVIILASMYFRRRIGGITGDCLGATFQFVEIATYAAFLT